jgi:putative transposase
LGLSTGRAAGLHPSGKPVENAFIESFNGRLRDECLNVHQFPSLAEAQLIIEAGRLDYNHRRPHSSLGPLTPNEFVIQRQAIRAAEEVVCSG